MKINDWIMVFAVLLAPVIAIQVSVFLENRREKRRLKLKVFATLMSTRAATISQEHVNALNMIDVVFYEKGKRDVAVRDAWKLYLDHLADRNSPPDIWDSKRIDLLTSLLYEMALSLKFDFDKVHIKRSIYSPEAHGRIEMDQNTIRTKLVEILSGQKPLSIKVVNPEGN